MGRRLADHTKEGVYWKLDPVHPSAAGDAGGQGPERKRKRVFRARGD